MIRPYLRDIINDHKTPENLKVYSSNEVIDYEAYQYGECKIQLIMSINSIYFKGSDKTRNMRTKSDNIEIMMGSEIMILLKNYAKISFAKISRRIRRINEKRK